MFFIKYKQGFDSIDQYRPQRSLKSYGIPNKIMHFTKMMLSQARSKVIAWNGASRSLVLGLVQGTVTHYWLSPCY